MTQFTLNVDDALRIPFQGSDESSQAYAARIEAIRLASSADFGEPLGWHWGDVTQTDAVAIAFREARPSDPADQLNALGGRDIGFICG